MALELRVLVNLPGSWVHFPTASWRLTCPCNYSFRGYDTLFWPLWELSLHMVYRNTCRENNNNNNSNTNTHPHTCTSTSEWEKKKPRSYRMTLLFTCSVLVEKTVSLSSYESPSASCSSAPGL